MLKATAAVGVFIVAILLALNAAVSSGGLLRYAKIHQDSKWAGCRMPFYFAHLFYSIQHYDDAITYFSFVSENSPHSEEGQESAFYAIVCKRMLGTAKQQDYVDFVQTYSSGTYHETVTHYLDGSIALQPSVIR